QRWTSTPPLHSLPTFNRAAWTPRSWRVRPFPKWLPPWPSPGRPATERTLAMRTLPLPIRDGVGPSCVALPTGDWPTIAAFLVQRFAAIPRSTWEARIQAGQVVDEHGVPVTETPPFEPRLRILYYRSLHA